MPFHRARLSPSAKPCLRSFAILTAAALSLLGPLGSGRALSAQPFGVPGSYLQLTEGEDYVEVPNAATLNPASQFTLEFWSYSGSLSGCHSLVGKGFTSSFWVGDCDGTLRSYVGGELFDAGKIQHNQTVHIAVTYDGVHRRHYIDGELVGVVSQTGELAPNANPWRFGGDVDYSGGTPDGIVFEVRLWSTARTQAQIRQLIGKEVRAAQPGLISAWHLRDNALDAIGHHDGHLVGAASFQSYSGYACFGDGFFACLHAHRFRVSVRWQVFSAPAPNGVVQEISDGVGTIVPGSSDDSVLFWFFDAANWEMLVKIPSGTCAAPFNRFWVFAAATTNVHTRLVVFDNGPGGQAQRIYFGYSGPPAPALTDTDAFATCP